MLYRTGAWVLPAPGRGSPHPGIGVTVGAGVVCYGMTEKCDEVEIRR